MNGCAGGARIGVGDGDAAERLTSDDMRTLFGRHIRIAHGQASRPRRPDSVPGANGPRLAVPQIGDLHGSRLVHLAHDGSSSLLQSKLACTTLFMSSYLLPTIEGIRRLRSLFPSVKRQKGARD
jgi:hypothetical protein